MVWRQENSAPTALQRGNLQRRTHTRASFRCCCSWNFDTRHFAALSGWMVAALGRQPHLGFSSMQSVGTGAGSAKRVRLGSSIATQGELRSGCWPAAASSAEVTSGAASANACAEAVGALELLMAWHRSLPQASAMPAAGATTWQILCSTRLLGNVLATQHGCHHLVHESGRPARTICTCSATLFGNNRWNQSLDG